MAGVVLSRLWMVGLVLVLLTLVSAFTSEGGGLSPLAIIAIFAIAAFKAELVLDNFMEAPHAERHWQILYRLWISAVTLLLIAAFAFQATN